MSTKEHTEQLHAKQNGNYDLENSRMETLKQFRSAQSVQMSPELFEKLYLSPMNEVKGDLRKTFGNPTPMYVVALSQLMILAMLCFQKLIKSQQCLGWLPSGLYSSHMRSNGLARRWR